MKKVILLLLAALLSSCATIPQSCEIKTTTAKCVGPIADVRIQSDADYHFMIGSLLEQEGDFDRDEE